MRARVALPIDVLSSPNLNNRHQNHLHRRHEQQTSCGGSGMRAVFLATHSSSQRECGGTGVFLPRGRTLSHGYNSLESKRKPGKLTYYLHKQYLSDSFWKLRCFPFHWNDYHERKECLTFLALYFEFFGSFPSLSLLCFLLIFCCLLLHHRHSLLHCPSSFSHCPSSKPESRRHHLQFTTSICIWQM